MKDNFLYRVGRFSSSQISSLATSYGKVKMNEEELAAFKLENPKSRVTTKAGGFGAPALTLIEEKNMEWKLGRSLATSVYSQAIAWGYLMEVICFEMLGAEYKLISTDWREYKDKEFLHYWCGTPDYEIEGLLISECKCYQLKNFSLYTDCLMEQDIENLKSKFPQEYWQIVSNCIINDVKIGEAISFMPYKSDLERIRQEVEETNILERYGFEPWQYRFLTEKAIGGLAYIREGGYYKNLTKFRFIVPEEDKQHLKNRVREAMTLLLKYQEK